MDLQQGSELFNASPWTAMTTQAKVSLLLLFGQAIARLPALVAALFIIIVTYWCARSSHRWATALGHRLVRSSSLRLLFDKSVVAAIWLTGSLIAGLFLFPSLRLGDVFATLGLGSVAIGFAFQDIFKNFLAGILLLINEPFRMGDQIAIADYEGTVEHIDIRSTHLRTYKGERVLIPNSLVFTSSVEVRTAFPLRRTDLMVGVAYDTDLAVAIELVCLTLANVEGVLAEPPPQVDATEFADSAISLVVKYWTNSLQQDSMRTRSRVVMSIKVAFEKSGIVIPYPIRTVLLTNSNPTTA